MPLKRIKICQAPEIRRRPYRVYLKLIPQDQKSQP